MKLDNLIKLKSWQLNNDGYGSQFKSLDDKIIAVELKKVKVTKNVNAYNNVKIFLNHFFEKKFFDISKNKGFKITYKTKGLNRVEFVIEEENDLFRFYTVLPPSEKWTTKIIKIDTFINESKNKSNIKEKKITGFVFNLMFSTDEERSGSLYIKEFIVKGYEIVSLVNSKYLGHTNFWLKKSLLNKIKIFLLNKRRQNKILDSEGNPLYCIYPFYQFTIYMEYLTVCCDIRLDENVDFEKNKNLLDIWWDEKFNKIREGIKDLSYSECNLKRCIQYNTTRESFKNLKTIKSKYPDIADYLEGKIKKFTGLPRYVLSGFDSRCNLTCRSCNASRINNQSKEIGNKYIKQIEDAGENLEKILISAHGDPFASPIYRNWLNNFPSEKFPKLKTIEIMTNALLWTEENWDKVSKNVKKHDIDAIISIDGATKKTYEYNRGNAKFEILIKNLGFISGLRKRNEIRSLALCFVIQKNNYKEIPLMIDFAKKYSFDSIHFSRITNWDSYEEKEFKTINIFNKKHSEYKNFKKIYDDIRKNKYGVFQVYFGFQL